MRSAPPLIRGGWEGFLLCLLLLFTFPLLAVADLFIGQPDARQQQQEKPQPIRNAPSLRTPAAPAYQTNLQELGYQDADDLLKQTLPAQSSVNSVAFDGGGQLASGSSDGTVKLWDVASGELKQTLPAQSRVLSVAFDGGGQLASGSDDGTVKLWDKASQQRGGGALTLLAVHHGMWLRLDAAGAVALADDGSLLRKGTLLDEGELSIKVKQTDYSAKEPVEKLVEEQVKYASTRWEYLPAPASSPAGFSAQPEQNELTLAAGQATLFTLTLSNTGAQPVHRPHIVTNVDSAEGLRIIPAEPQAAFPQAEGVYSRSSLIPPGGSIRLAARVIMATPEPLSSGVYKLPVTVNAGGQSQQLTLTINVKAPNLGIRIK